MNEKAVVITVSDKASRGERIDTSGPMLVGKLQEDGWQVVWTEIVPDEEDRIRQALLHGADELGAALILTTGGTGFSPRDITPEVTLQVVERLTPGIPEAMRAESMRITPRGCLSRSVAGIRGRSLIVNLPGSKKAAAENYDAVSGAIRHGIQMLASDGSADCAAPETAKKNAPSLDRWLKEAKAQENAGQTGMYLFHNGVVRETAKAAVRSGAENTAPVKGMLFSWDSEKVAAAEEQARQLEGITYVRVWLNEGQLRVGDDLMLVLVGGDIRPHVLGALEQLVKNLKETCVKEQEIF